MNTIRILRQMLLLSLTTVALACGGKQEPESAEDNYLGPSATCDFREEATSRWNHQIEKDLNLAVKIVDGEYEAADAEKVTSLLNQFTEDWISIRDWVCREYETSRPQSQSAYQIKVECLNRALAEQTDIVESIKKNEKDTVWRLEKLLASLESCR